MEKMLNKKENNSQIPVVSVTNISFAYDRLTVLENINLTIHKGDFLGIIGPNGGGKTTLVKLILGLLKLKKGAIRVLGTLPKNARSRVAYVPQHAPEDREFPIAVWEVALQGRLQSSGWGYRYTREDRQRAADELQRVEMWEFRKRPVSALSGGQRQRVFLARALCRDPEILFLDEPTVGIDSRAQENIYDLLQKLNQRMTIVIITHDIGVISQYVRSVACVNRILIAHNEGLITAEMLEKTYNCPVDLIAHGVPHRLFQPHSS